MIIQLLSSTGLSIFCERERKTIKPLNLIVEILLYLVMLIQMLYAFFGDIAHKIFGLVFFLRLPIVTETVVSLCLIPS